MPLTPIDWKRILAGFMEAPLRPTQRPARLGSPVKLTWTHEGTELRYRLWGFEISHGGNTRHDNEYRIQVSNGPRVAMNEGGYRDMLLGFVEAEDLVVVYSSMYLAHFLERSLLGERPSPSVQVGRADLVRAAGRGFHSFTKETEIAPDQIIAVMTPSFLPAFLVEPDGLINGTVLPETVVEAMPAAETDLTSFCEGRGFHFPSPVLARYVAALAAKPFVILAGTTGTGKTKLAQLVAEFYCREGGAAEGSGGAVSWDDIPEGAELMVVEAPGSTPDRTRIAFVPVRPDWTDNQALLGFYNPVLQRYEPTSTLLLVLRALAAEREARNAGTAPPSYFLILDEMNLARVEHYFSDFLSVIETRKLGVAGRIEAETIPLHSMTGVEVQVPTVDGEMAAVPIPAYLEIPTNLFVIGTVNVDETTYGFSPKVLDRANVIEFHEVNLDRLRGEDVGAAAGPVPTLFASLPRFSLPSQATYRDAAPELHEWMKALNTVLAPTRLHAGYRGVCEMALFIRHLAGSYADVVGAEAANRLGMDAAILQKILPRLHGNRARLGDPLARLHHFLRVGELPGAGFRPEEELLVIHAEAAGVAFPLSRARLVEMLVVLNDFGFVSFFR
jgi:hypothetical protein